LSLFTELKRRNVFRVLLAYIVVAWLLMQIGDTLAPALRLPEWVTSLLAFFLVLGLPLAIFFAWAYELTPEGVRNQKDVDQDSSTTTKTGRKLDYAIIALLTVSLGYFIWESRFQLVEDDGPAVVETLATSTKQSIAVLPFENRSNREEDQFFTDGIHDDLLTTIAKIGSMKVISRTSVMEYKNTVKKIPQIARELGVANILEGGIQRSGDQVRINVQLIDAVTDEHLWAETYDRELTAQNLFSIQSEISIAIADALHSALSEEEKQKVDAMPTNNLQALEFYLRGRQLTASRTAEDLREAISQFNHAVELDPDFALAWVGVADSNRLYGAYGPAMAQDLLPIRETAIRRALEIDDRLGEAYTSLGSLYADRNEFEDAEIAFKQAIQYSPNYATAWQWYAAVVNRDSSRADESLELLRRAAELDPRSSIISMNIAHALHSRGLYSQAERQYLAALEIDPEFIIGIRALAYFYMSALGRFDEAMIYARQLIELDPDQSNYASSLYVAANIYINVDDLTAAQYLIDRMAELNPDHRGLPQLRIERDLRAGDTSSTQESLDLLVERASGRHSTLQNAGFYQLAIGDKDRARILYLSANPDWLNPNHRHTRQSLIGHGCIVAWILMNTGDREQGENLLRQAISSFNDTSRPNFEHSDEQRPEVCYLTDGDVEKALNTVETQIAHGHFYDWHIYSRLPMYDLIRDHARYEAALQERERRMRRQRELIASHVAVHELVD